MAIMDNFTWSSGSFSPLPSRPGSSGACDQVHSPTRQNRNGAVTGAVPSALTRGPAHFDWHWRERPALALLAGKPASRSKNDATPHPPMASLICRNTREKINAATTQIAKYKGLWDVD